ncbi:unnamed protein product, partial [marine sediment metagenome]
YGKDQATGVLVPPRDVEAMASGIVALLTDEPLRCQLGENAATDVRERFDLNQQVDAYLEWYHTMAGSIHARTGK